MKKTGKCENCKCSIPKPHHRSTIEDRLCLKCLNTRLVKIGKFDDDIIKAKIAKVLKEAGETIDE